IACEGLPGQGSSLTAVGVIRKLNVFDFVVRAVFYPGWERRNDMTKFGIGQPVPRSEDPRFLTGRGRYVGDINLPRQAYGYVLRSPHAHARLQRIETAAATSAPGVLAVLTGADAAADKLGGIPVLVTPAAFGGPPGYQPVCPVLVRERARHVGDSVGFIVAETL